MLSTAGTGLGGDRIDQLIFQELLFPLLGKGESWSRIVDGRDIDTPFPFDDYEEGLLNWAITHTLNQNQYKSRLTTAIANGGAGGGEVRTPERPDQLQLQLQRLSCDPASEGRALGAWSRRCSMYRN